MLRKLPVFAEKHPLRLFWDAIIIIAIFVVSALTPYRLTFDDYSMDWVYWLLTILFSLDVLISLNTNFEVNQIVITKRQEIRRNYLRTWFPLDLIAALPLAYIFSFSDGLYFASFLLDAIAISRLLPLLKLLKGRTLFKRLETALFLNPSEMRIVVFLFWFALMTHLMALGWVTIGAGEIYGGDDFHQYLLAVYWTITTIATIGYGDIVPDLDDNIHIGYTIAVQLLGVGLFGYIIGNISSFITEIDMTRTKFTRKTEEINTFLRNRKLPLSIQERFRSYRDYLWERRHISRMDSVFRELPESLHVEILLHLNKKIVQKASLFKQMDELFIRDLVQVLEPMVYLPNDLIIREGEYGDCMYFLSTGAVEILAGNQRIAILESGSPFGESALVQHEKRNASVKTLSYCEVFQLTKKKFELLRKRYPKFDSQLQDIVAERLHDTAEKLVK